MVNSSYFPGNERNTTQPKNPLYPIIGGGMALAGAIMGGKNQRQVIDPGMLKNLFGPGAIAGETQDLYKMLLNSPAFSAMMNSASLQGSRVAGASNANMASRGLSATPYGGFLKAAGRGYGSSLQRQGKQNLFLQALQTALQNIHQRQGLYGQSYGIQQQTPTWGQQVGGALMSGGAQGLLGWGK